MPDYRFAKGGFTLHAPHIAYINSDGTYSDPVPIPAAVKWTGAVKPSEPERTFTFSTADLSLSTGYSFTWNRLTHKQFKFMLRTFGFNRRRFSRKIQHNIARRNARVLARLRKKYPLDLHEYDEYPADTGE